MAASPWWTVKARGNLTTAIGMLAIERVDVLTPAQVTEADARRAGFASRAALLQELDRTPDGSIHRIAVRFAGADPRVALRTARLSTDDWRALEAQLRRMDARAPGGPWVMAALEIIAARPSTRAEILAERLGLARDIFKNRVRRLKALGLTESLETGYRLSPRGRDALKRLRG